MLKLMLEREITLKVIEHTFCLLCCRAHSKLEVSVQPPQMKWTKELNEANNLTLPLLILPFDIKTVSTFLLDIMWNKRTENNCGALSQRGRFFALGLRKEELWADLTRSYLRVADLIDKYTLPQKCKCTCLDVTGIMKHNHGTFQVFRAYA